MTKPLDTLICPTCRNPFIRSWKRQKFCSAECQISERIDKSGQCWLWTGATNNVGYGQVRIAGKAHYVHRLMLMLSGRLHDNSAVVMHACDNPRCCNPSHLVVGTQRDNLADMRRKGRGKNPPILRGENVNGARLTSETVASIRSEFAAGFRETTIAKRYGISPSHAGRINRREVWRHC